jgi:hypothetical protein
MRGESVRYTCESSHLWWDHIGMDLMRGCGSYAHENLGSFGRTFSAVMPQSLIALRSRQIVSRLIPNSCTSWVCLPNRIQPGLCLVPPPQTPAMPHIVAHSIYARPRAAAAGPSSVVTRGFFCDQQLRGRRCPMTCQHAHVFPMWDTPRSMSNDGKTDQYCLASQIPYRMMTTLVRWLSYNGYVRW